MSDDARENGQGQTQPPVEVNKRHVIDILKHCLRCFASEYGLTTEQFGGLTMDEFVPWCVRCNMPWRDVQSICSKTYANGDKIPPATVQAITADLRNPFAAVKLLYEIWHAITDPRGAMHNPAPVSLQTEITATYDDGTAFGITLTSELRNQTVSDGLFRSLLLSQTSRIVEALTVNGVDNVRQQHAKPIPKQEGGDSDDHKGAEPD